jgi:hypothetical protein
MAVEPRKVNMGRASANESARRFVALDHVMYDVCDHDYRRQ